MGDQLVLFSAVLFGFRQGVTQGGDDVWSRRQLRAGGGRARSRFRLFHCSFLVILWELYTRAQHFIFGRDLTILFLFEVSDLLLLCWSALSHWYFLQFSKASGF